jgi:roadblock/LC7 domain-containing protein
MVALLLPVNSLYVIMSCVSAADYNEDGDFIARIVEVRDHNREVDVVVSEFAKCTPWMLSKYADCYTTMVKEEELPNGEHLIK